MKRIELGNGKVALIDTADAALVAGFNWRLAANGYVKACRGQMRIYLHRLIAGAGPRQRIDHVNGDPLDNRTTNLRFASAAENRANAGPNRQRGRTSRFKGVSWKARDEKWVAHIHVNGKTRYLGAFLDEFDAADAYDRAALAEWPTFARLNEAERGASLVSE